jgi:hypothetical protein
MILFTIDNIDTPLILLLRNDKFLNNNVLQIPKNLASSEMKKKIFPFENEITAPHFLYSDYE